MRRKERYITNGAFIGFAYIAFADVLLQYLEHVRIKKALTWKSFNCKRTLNNALIGGAIGAGVGYLIYDDKISEEAEHPFNCDEYLKKLLSEENLKSKPLLLKKYLSYKAEIKEWMNLEFKSNLISKAEDAGSFFKRTAIVSNTDLDIVLAFRKNSFFTLEQMYYHVYDSLQTKFGDKAMVSKQTKAIGLTFENNGLPIHFDIVPGREIGNYKVAKELNLYVRPDWGWQKGSSFKTNIVVQNKITLHNPEARKVIKLLKIYKERNGIELPSVIIEQCVVAALSEGQFGVDFSYTENLLNSMKYTARKIQQNTYLDITNSNNNLNSKLNYTERNNLAHQILMDIESIKKNPRYIKEIFIK